MKITINNAIFASEVSGKIILFHNQNDVSNKIFELEKSAATIWGHIAKNNITVSELHERLSSKYESYTEKDKKDTEIFLDELRANKIIL